MKFIWIFAVKQFLLVHFFASQVLKNYVIDDLSKNKLLAVYSMKNVPWNMERMNMEHSFQNMKWPYIWMFDIFERVNVLNLKPMKMHLE